MRCRYFVASAIFTLAAFAASSRAAPQTRPAGASPADAIRGIVSEAVRGGEGGVAAARRVADGSPELRRWAESNAEALAGVTAGPLPEQPWGLVTYRAAPRAGEAARLYLHVFEWHAGANVIVYGLSDAPGQAYLLSDANRVALPAERRGRGVVVSVPKKQPDPLATVVVLEFEREPTAVPLAIAAAADGTILLHAREAIVHGKTLRYEPEPHKDTIGYWSNPADWVRWDFEVAKPGTYAVEILQGCGKGSGGSTVEFAVGEQTLPVTVQDTGGFQNFVPRDIGKVTLPKPGKYTLTVKPTKKQGAAVMDLRQVRLKPAEKMPNDQAPMTNK